ncbi:unnamed protein product [Protopolystoma xenopodis]|uniref:C2H2-type domain-containing protein n=1 Tax=Protopolystoma xenopodis TaxID=117903 RepID=A0A448XCE1_9PLAT|nr:unnamed protein product [Protopolystoma xenopodis]
MASQLGLFPFSSVIPTNLAGPLLTDETAVGFSSLSTCLGPVGDFESSPTSATPVTEAALHCSSRLATHEGLPTKQDEPVRSARPAGVYISASSSSSSSSSPSASSTPPVASRHQPSAFSHRFSHAAGLSPGLESIGLIGHSPTSGSPQPLSTHLPPEQAPHTASLAPSVIPSPPLPNQPLVDLCSGGTVSNALKLIPMSTSSICLSSGPSPLPMTTFSELPSHPQAPPSLLFLGSRLLSEPDVFSPGPLDMSQSTSVQTHAGLAVDPTSGYHDVLATGAKPVANDGYSLLRQMVFKSLIQAHAANPTAYPQVLFSLANQPLGQSSSVPDVAGFGPMNASPPPLALSVPLQTSLMPDSEGHLPGLGRIGLGQEEATRHTVRGAGPDRLDETVGPIRQLARFSCPPSSPLPGTNQTNQTNQTIQTNQVGQSVRHPARPTLHARRRSSLLLGHSSSGPPRCSYSCLPRKSDESAVPYSSATDKVTPASGRSSGASSGSQGSLASMSGAVGNNMEQWKRFKCSGCGHRSNWKWDINKHIKVGLKASQLGFSAVVWLVELVYRPLIRLQVAHPERKNIVTITMNLEEAKATLDDYLNRLLSRRTQRPASADSHCSSGQSIENSGCLASSLIQGGQDGCQGAGDQCDRESGPGGLSGSRGGLSGESNPLMAGGGESTDANPSDSAGGSLAGEGYYRPYMCMTCGHRSNWRWDVKKHMKQMHNSIGQLVTLSNEEAKRTIGQYKSRRKQATLARQQALLGLDSTSTSAASALSSTASTSPSVIASCADAAFMLATTDFATVCSTESAPQRRRSVDMGRVLAGLPDSGPGSSSGISRPGVRLIYETQAVVEAAAAAVEVRLAHFASRYFCHLVFFYRIIANLP